MELACDASLKNRRYDADGRLHILRTPISKATVNPYYGKEIPDSAQLGLQPDRIYYLLRDPGELAKAAPKFARNQLMMKHIAVSAEEPEKESIAGTVGSDVEFIAPYLIADLCVWDNEAIAGIETDAVRELSSSYRYRADMTPGVYEGQRYDGVMRDIQGNHVALVPQGRAGSDVRAADSQLEMNMETKFGKALYAILCAASPKLAADSRLRPMVIGLTRKQCDLRSLEPKLLAMDAELRKEDTMKAMEAAKDASEEEESKEEREERERREKEAKDKKAKDGRKRAKDMSFEEWAKEEEDEPEHSEDRRKARDAEEDDEDRAKREEYKRKAEDAEKMCQDDFKGLVEKLKRKGYSHEYATKIAGKVANEKGMNGGKDSKAKDAEEDEKERERKAEDRQRRAMDAFRQELRDAEEARRAVAPVVGDVLAQDSAEDIYKFALDQMKVDRSGVSGVAAHRALFRAAQAAAQPVRQPAFDSASVEEKFAGASRSINRM